MPSKKVYIVGCGMTEFLKPQSHLRCYPDLASEAINKALKDARIPYSKVNQAVVGYTYGDSDSAQCALYEIGLTGIPIHNTNNACSTGSAAIYLGKQLIRNDENDCVLVLGFDKFEQEAYSFKYTDRTSPFEKLVIALSEVIPESNGKNFTIQLLDAVGKEYMRKYNFDFNKFAEIAYKNHKHSVHNPYARLQKAYTIDEIKNSAVICGGLTKLQYCPLSDAAACVILASEKFVREHSLEDKAVEIVGIEMATDFPSTFISNSPMNLVGYEMTKVATQNLFKKTKYTINDVNIVELHDGATTNEVITYEALGLCKEGEASDFIDRKDNTYGGKYVVNPSGGLMSRGHAPGATGVAQCCELCWQLRGDAQQRQVENAKLALHHNIGWGGSVVVALYRLGFPQSNHLLAKLYNTLSTGFCPRKSRKNRKHLQIEQENVQIVTKSIPKVKIPDLDKFNLNPDAFIVHKYFGAMLKVINNEPIEVLRNYFGGYGFKAINDNDNSYGYWLFSVTREGSTCKYNTTELPDVLCTIKDKDLPEILRGRYDARKAFILGKVKIEGNMSMAIKLVYVLKKFREKIDNACIELEK